MMDFSIRMRNRLYFSHCDTPYRPITTARMEILNVDLQGDILMIASQATINRGHNRIYARLAVELAYVSAFMILPELPARIADECFFPAQGTVLVFGADATGLRRLHAGGTDNNSGLCHGWIFDAVEEPDAVA